MKLYKDVDYETVLWIKEQNAIDAYEQAIEEFKRLVEEYARLNERLRRRVDYVNSICSLRAPQGREV